MAKRLGIRLQILEVRSADELEGAFRAATKDASRCSDPDPRQSFHTRGERIADLATKNRLPTMAGDSEAVNAGGLMYYGASLPDLNRRAATYVDKILKGAKPADLPVEQPKKFESIINLKAAKQIRPHDSAERLCKSGQGHQVILDFSTARSFGEVYRERSRRAQDTSPNLDSVKEGQ